MLILNVPVVAVSPGLVKPLIVNSRVCPEAMLKLDPLMLLTRIELEEKEQVGSVLMPIPTIDAQLVEEVEIVISLGRVT